MSHKDMCMTYVERRKLEDENGAWWICLPDSTVLEEGPYSEDEIDRILWDRALGHAHEDYLP